MRNHQHSFNILLTVLFMMMMRRLGTRAAFVGPNVLRRTIHHKKKILCQSGRALSSSVLNHRQMMPLRESDLIRCYSTTPEVSMPFFSRDNESFKSIGVTSVPLQKRLDALGVVRPSAVQAAAFEPIRAGESVTVGAETGSGKTLSYLLPLVEDILLRKEAAAAENSPYFGYDYCRAIILVPNKELVQQVLRMALDVCGGPRAFISSPSRSPTGNLASLSPNDDHDSELVDPNSLVRIAVMPGGLKEPLDYLPFRHSIAFGGSAPPVDLLISTPAAIGPLGLKPKHIDFFADVETLVIDEADMLLDGGYIKSLEQVLVGFRRADKLDESQHGVKKTQHVFVAATLPDQGTRSVDAYLKRKFRDLKRIQLSGMHSALHYGLKSRTEWIQEDSNKARMEHLVNLLGKDSSEGGLKNEKVMIFLNSVDHVEGANTALQKAGIQTVIYHAKYSLDERTQNLDRFRRYGTSQQKKDSVGVLVCTDLAARGLDVPGVTVIVQLQFAGNVVTHLHRMGRCGRAGQRTGRGIIFYNEKQRDLVQVVREAEAGHERFELEQDVDSDEFDDDDGNDSIPKTSVKKAFSRRRGFSKQRKKWRRKQGAAMDDGDDHHVGDGMTETQHLSATSK